MATPTQMEVLRASARVANTTRHYGPDHPSTLAMRAEWHFAKSLDYADKMRVHLHELTPDQRAQVIAALTKEN